MSLSSLKVPQGAKSVRKRVGRGQASGLGKTAGRGGKGQKARTGNMRFEGFEGGQMPLQRRLPKFGFTTFRRRELAEVAVGDLQGLGGLLDAAALRAHGLVRGRFDGVVVLGGGELTSAVTVKVDRVTAGARATIEKAGGTVELVPAPQTMHERAKAARAAAQPRRAPKPPKPEQPPRAEQAAKADQPARAPKPAKAAQPPKKPAPPKA
jgi:large subunit ribosomal protein L15